MTNVAFLGVRHEDTHAAIVTIVKDGAPIVKLPHVRFHSPGGFEWGYEGSGPADLSLSLLEYVIQNSNEFSFQERVQNTSLGSGLYCSQLAWQLHQPFKREFVARWKDSWSIQMNTIIAWINTKRKETA